MTYAWLIDTTKCMGCHDCVVACKDEFVDNDWSPYAAPQPATGHFWMNLSINERGQLPGKIKVNNFPFLCNHCTTAPCQSAAKNGAVYTRSDGLVIIDPVKSVGQQQIVSACPYGVIYWNSTLGIPQKCNGCAHLLDNGWTQPRCVNACPTGAITFGTLASLQSQITSLGAKVFHPEYNTGPQVYYVGTGAQGLVFIAGALYATSTDAAIQGATVTVTAGSTNVTATSDIFGDFWVDGLAANTTYTVTITATGHATVTKTVSTSSGSQDLGDIGLT
jgi:Fe-S-cluster-containing dehydrogenase component